MVPAGSQELTHWSVWSYGDASGAVVGGLSRNNTQTLDTPCRIDTPSGFSGYATAFRARNDLPEAPSSRTETSQPL